MLEEEVLSVSIAKELPPLLPTHVGVALDLVPLPPERVNDLAPSISHSLSNRGGHATEDLRAAQHPDVPIDYAADDFPG